MKPKTPRLAVRAIILHNNRLLMVNAWPDGQSDLWCVPGGGVHSGSSLPDNLIREVHEECGLNIIVGAPCLINEFHDPTIGFHQVEVYFRCVIRDSHLPTVWQDPEGIVTKRQFVTREQLSKMRHKPDSLDKIAWGDGVHYDPLELIQR